MPDTYDCCEHCEHDDILTGDSGITLPHEEPCEEGCNDEAVTRA